MSWVIPGCARGDPLTCVSPRVLPRAPTWRCCLAFIFSPIKLLTVSLIIHHLAGSHSSKHPGRLTPLLDGTLPVPRLDIPTPPSACTGFDAQIKSRANHRPRILISDGFGTHESLEILKYCYENNIILCRLPSHTSHKLQPCDVGIFGPLKKAYREQVDQLYRGGRQHNRQAALHSSLQPCTCRITPRNIKAGWSKCGLFPFNPDRVLGEIQKHQEDTFSPRTDRIPQSNPLLR